MHPHSVSPGWHVASCWQAQPASRCAWYKGTQYNFYIKAALDTNKVNDKC